MPCITWQCNNRNTGQDYGICRNLLVWILEFFLVPNVDSGEALCPDCPCPTLYSEVRCLRHGTNFDTFRIVGHRKCTLLREWFLWRSWCLCLTQMLKFIVHVSCGIMSFDDSWWGRRGIRRRGVVLCFQVWVKVIGKPFKTFRCECFVSIHR